MTRPDKEPRSKKSFRNLGALLLTILLLPLILVVVVAYVVYRASILAAVWLVWCTRGKFILFVYSDSPIWKDYIAEHLLPEADGHAVVLNWSERRNWATRFSLPVIPSRAVGGIRQFNPMAVVFRPFR